MLPEEMKNTYEKLGIPEAERKFLAGVTSQYECLRGSTRVWTTDGMLPIKALAAGDRVFSLDETTKQIVEAEVRGLASSGDKEIFEIRARGRVIGGLVKVNEGAHGVKSHVRCDALILDEDSRSDTYPYMEIDEKDARIGHEATVSKVGDDQLFYLMTRGLSEQQAVAMIVNGFIEPITKTLPMEYAVELSRLIELNMEGSVG